MDIDERIEKIIKKMDRLSEKHPKFNCGAFPPKWDKPLSETTVANYEKENGIILPKDYRRFITSVAGSGTQPFYGLYSLIKNEITVAVNQKFPYTVRKPLNVEELSDTAYNAFLEKETDKGYVPLCHEGCGMYSILIVNTDDEETYGTVWYYDLSNDAGIFPLVNPINHKTMGFLDWLEYYADKTLELNDDDFFSYGELAGIIK